MYQQFCFCEVLDGVLVAYGKFELRAKSLMVRKLVQCLFEGGLIRRRC